MIYLDYNSTHPPDQDVLQDCLQAYGQNFANSSGLSYISQQVYAQIEQSREDIASIFQVSSKQIIFTSSASEANYIALFTAYRFLVNKYDNVHIAVSALEHPSITDLIAYLPSVIIHELPLDKGRIDTNVLEDLCKKQQIHLLLAMLVHNETGIIQPWEEIKYILSKYDQVIAICDAVQALSKIKHEIDLPDIKSDIISIANSLPIFFTFSGHKIGAGFGTGLIVLPNSCNDHILPLVSNQFHEFGFRPGSHNFSSIMAFSKVLNKIFYRKQDYTNLEQITYTFERNLINILNTISKTIIIGHNSHRLAGTTLVMSSNIDIDCLRIGLDQNDIIVSTGTSCKSSVGKASLGLLSMGFSNQEAESVIRFSYNHLFSTEQQDIVCGVIRDMASLQALKYS